MHFPTDKVAIYIVYHMFTHILNFFESARDDDGFIKLLVFLAPVY